MPTYIQLRDGVGYAVVRTHGEPDHSVTPDHTTAILCECTDENPDQFLKMKYDEKTNSWSKAPLIRYAEINEDGEIMEIKRTYFEHEVTGVLMTDETKATSKFIDGAWVHIEPIIPIEPIIAVVEPIKETPKP